MTTPPVPPEAVEAAASVHTQVINDLIGQKRTPETECHIARVMLEAASPVLRDHWQAGGALHELVFTDREGRPAKWQTRCGREDVPLERTTSPDPAGYYRVDCPACLRVAELEALADEILAAFRPRRDRAGHRASTRRDVVDRWRVTLAGEK